ITAIATSVKVECIFSQGQLVLSHMHNRLDVQSTRALLCLGEWSLFGMVKDADILSVTKLPGKQGDEEELEEGWDRIDVN
ncbi:hypothetical protein AN958_09641, partial [Leucoagaricus sp. SymC.cos]